MPLIEISSPNPVSDAQALLGRVQRAGADALGCALDSVWVALDGKVYLGTATAVVTIRAQARAAPLRDAFTVAVAGEVARALGLPPGEVWVHYQEILQEDVWVGGRWVAP